MMNDDVVWVDPDGKWRCAPDGKFIVDAPFNVGGVMQGMGDTPAEAQANAELWHYIAVTSLLEFSRQLHGGKTEPQKLH